MFKQQIEGACTVLNPLGMWEKNLPCLYELLTLTGRENDPSG